MGLSWSLLFCRNRALVVAFAFAIAFGDAFSVAVAATHAVAPAFRTVPVYVAVDATVAHPDNMKVFALKLEDNFSDRLCRARLARKGEVDELMVAAQAIGKPIPVSVRD